MDPITIYTNFIKEIDKFTKYKDCDALKTETLLNLKNHIISYEDMFPIMHIAMRTSDIQEFDQIKHLFIDEAQDISYFGYHVLREALPNAYFSIFGDLAQGLYSYQAIDNWQELQNIFQDLTQLPLNKSYRTSIEIMDEANTTLDKLGMDRASNVVRHGEAVERRKGNANTLIETELSKMRQKGLKSLAIICKDKVELSKAIKTLADMQIRLLDENNATYDESDVALMTVQTAKGLEFDGVIVYNENSYNQNNKLDLKQLFVAKTRALHKLYLNQL